MKTSTSLTAIAALAGAAPAMANLHKCPRNEVQPRGTLDGLHYVQPSVMLPISKLIPDAAFPAAPWAATMPGDLCTIFNHEIPLAEAQGKICNLVFDLPAHGKRDFPNSYYAFDGPGHFTFTGYEIGQGAIPGVTTYNNQPAEGISPVNPPAVIQPGNSYVINSFPCPTPDDHPGDKVLISGKLCSSDTTLFFKESAEGQCPRGFFFVITDAPQGKKGVSRHLKRE